MSNSASQHIGVIGLGIIGSRVAENLDKAGYEVFVWSRSPRAIPNFLANPREVAESAHTLQIFVRDDAALLAAIEDMLPALTPAHLILNHATVSPSATLEAAERVSKTGAAFLDAPFTGSKMAAQNGKLVYYIGGDAGLMPLAEPVLKASSAKIMHVGKIGDATVLKIATNLITAVTVKGVQEAVALTQAQGVDPRKLLEAEEPNANFSPLIGMKLPAMIDQNFEAHFSLQNMLKDADFALALAGQKGLKLGALQAMADAMRTAKEAGKGDSDFSVIGEA
jgi:3-hydroxyisobutyrate dehydrogenase-like beta-hydroxyacid dehydrogenase